MRGALKSTFRFTQPNTSFCSFATFCFADYKINEIEDQKLLLDEIAIRRKKYYKSLVEKDPIQEINLKGWLNRVDDCLQRNI